MSDLKNPFAKRNGKIIVVSDLAQEEYGLRCNCTCAFCDSNMLAVLRTTKRRPHFAHNGKGCADEKSMLAALMQMIAEQLEDLREIVIPGLYIGYSPTKYKIERNQVDSYCPRYCDPSDVEEQCHYRVTKSKKVSIDSVIYKKEVEELSFTSLGHEIGVIIQFRRSNCNNTIIRSTPGRTDYEAILAIDLSELWEVVETSGTNVLRHLFLYETNNRIWQSNAKLEKAYDEVYAILVRERERLSAESIERLNRERERQKQERERLLFEAKEREDKKREQLAIKENECDINGMIWSFETDEQYALDVQKANKTFQNLRLHYYQRESESGRLVGSGRHRDEVEHDYAKEEMAKSFYASSIEKQYDSFGVRWFICERCGDLRDEEEMKDYGGSDRLNRGVCRYC